MTPIKDPEERKKYQREWAARNRAEWLEGKSCSDCGCTDQLEVDHDNPADKDPSLRGKKTIYIWSMSKERRAKELAGCVPRCVTCHRAKTSRERAQRQPRTHGATMYTYGCRCSGCCAWQSERLRIYRDKKRCGIK